MGSLKSISGEGALLPMKGRTEANLCNTRYSIHVRCTSLQQSVPVNSRFHIQVILNKDVQVISLVNIYERTRLLAIDEVHLTLESIWRVGSAVKLEAELA